MGVCVPNFRSVSFFVWPGDMTQIHKYTHTHMDKWMDACPVMETDGGRNQRNPLARLEIVYSGAVGASGNHTLSSRNVKTPFDTLRAI